ncbi:3-oxoacyl-[acyl-carrier-protein] synthase, mitochondrial-like isoform X2 [Liolophura sinensis]|uniref:3-oxoacyl-[acyl-carrier-protein] synthase, mitochondrial-like isoform X2 n=1 Tax=Liolophura sinensis TaxID=3198878 RepID=UPI003158E48A
MGTGGFDKIPSKVCGYVPRGHSPGQLNLDRIVPPADQRHMSLASAYALAAASEALIQANWKPISEADQRRSGVAIGLGMCDLDVIVDAGLALRVKGYNKISPYFIPTILTNMAAGWVSVKHGLQGPNHSVSTACTTGVHSIGDAFKMIQRGDADVMVAGSTEAVIGPLSMAGFSRLKALSTRYNDTPEQSSRPFDKGRDGFVMSEGSGMVVLENLEHAWKRGASIYGEIMGYGLSGDAHHLTAPRADGIGAQQCMMGALKDAGIEAEEVGYINAHATSTPLGDIAESQAIQSVFQERAGNLAVSSSKGAVGHLLGGAGSVEAIFTLLACHTGVIPPTINLKNQDPECADLNFVPNQSQNWSDTTRRIALTNSFGFGGTNSSLCIGQFVS